MTRFPKWRSIEARVYALVFLAFLSTGCIFAAASYYIFESLLEARYEQTRRLVEVAHAAVSAVDAEGRQRGEPQQETKARAIALLRTMHYDNDGYFWINDYDGMMLLHPRASLEGRSTLDLVDGAGRRLIYDFIVTAKTKGEGRHTYLWPPDHTAQEKFSYIKAHKNWGWVIGSGVYVNDINNEVYLFIHKITVAGLLAALIILVLAYRIGQSISLPIRSLNATMKEMADGNLDVEIRERNLRDEIGSMAQTVGVFLENAQRIKMLAAEEKDSEGVKTEFVSVVSHELRTPLTSIHGSLGLLVSGAVGTLPEKAQRLVVIANENCSRLIRLINDILDIDKAASGDMEFDCGPESVNRLLLEAVETNKNYAEKYFVQYVPTLLGEDALIYIDGGRLQQILSNFLSNAAKFSIGGAKVDVSATLKDGMARFTVRDYGLGIPEDFKMRIFRKFSQADSSSTRKKGGTGLGLYISKQLAEHMGGRIGYESRTGLGSTFWVEFPVIQGATQKNAQRAPTEEE